MCNTVLHIIWWENDSCHTRLDALTICAECSKCAAMGLGEAAVEWGEGGDWNNFETKKAQINSVGWQHMRVDNNKTIKAPSAAQHPIRRGGGGKRKNYETKKSRKSKGVRDTSLTNMSYETKTWLLCGSFGLTKNSLLCIKPWMWPRGCAGGRAGVSTNRRRWWTLLGKIKPEAQYWWKSPKPTRGLSLLTVHWKSSEGSWFHLKT